jgi:hypothetical protein
VATWSATTGTAPTMTRASTTTHGMNMRFIAFSSGY